MDPDARDLSPEPYDDLEDDLGDWTRDRSPTPVHDSGAGSSSKPRKRLLKKGGGGDVPGDDGLEDWGLEDADAELAAAKQGKGSSALRDLARGGSGKEKKRRREDDGRDSGMVREKRGFSGGKDSGGGGGHRDQDDDGEREIRELWDTIAGGDSEVNTVILAMSSFASPLMYRFSFSEADVGWVCMLQLLVVRSVVFVLVSWEL
jgi:transcription factor SPN1